MPSEHQKAVFNDLMRQIHIALNDDDIPIVEVLLRREDGVLLSFEPGYDYRPKEDMTEEKEKQDDRQ